MSIKISHHDLKKAQEKGIINTHQVHALWQYLNQQNLSSNNYNFSNLLFFLGGFIAIAAITIFLGTNFFTFGKWWLFCIALIYWVIGLIAAKIFNDKDLKTPRDISLLFVTSITPLLIFSIMKVLNIWENNPPFHVLGLIELLDWHSLVIELGTLLVACLLFWIAPSSLLMLPITLCSWVIAVDLPDHLNANLILTNFKYYSCIFGLICTLVAIYLDTSATKRTYCYWPYVVGLTAFWFGLLGSFLNNELSWFLFCVMNIVLLILGIVFTRKILLIYGGLGVSFYIGHLAYDIFHDSIYLPFILSLIGILIILCGVVVQKTKLPQSIANFVKRIKLNK